MENAFDSSERRSREGFKEPGAPFIPTARLPAQAFPAGDAPRLDGDAPVGSGVVAQVYRGVSRGRAVAVKVVHPTTAGAVASDLAALRFLAALLERLAPATCASLDPAGLVRDFAEKMERSVDMRSEYAAGPEKGDFNSSI